MNVHNLSLIYADTKAWIKTRCENGCWLSFSEMLACFDRLVSGVDLILDVGRYSV